VGHASYDHVFSVAHHPGPDEKLFADALTGCGGGPAANAAVAVARLGYRAAFAGYLGNDIHGQLHAAELLNEGVDTEWLVRGDSPTPVSAVIVKPDGARTVVCYKGSTERLPRDAIDFTGANPAVLLFDGHEPPLSEALIDRPVPKVLDAGSVHAGTESLMFRVDYLVCSEKFAHQWLGTDTPKEALQRLAERSPAVVITLGERGLIWQKAGQSGHLSAFPARAIDTTGAGDAFHGAFAAALAAGMGWLDTLRLASAAGAACCEALGARPGLPDRTRLLKWLGS
jgi:sulfofructose kinase